MTGQKLEEVFLNLLKYWTCSSSQVKNPKHLSGWNFLCLQVEQEMGTIYCSGPTRYSQSQPLDHGLRPASVVSS